MKFCHECDYKLTLGTEKHCPECSVKLQNEVKEKDDNKIDITKTEGDVIGNRFSGDGDIIAKDTKGNILNFYKGTISAEQITRVITSSTTWDVSPSSKTTDKNTKNLSMVIETKQQTSQILEKIDKMEKEEGREILEIKIGELQISKSELSLKELLLKGNEYFYKEEYKEAIDCYDKALEIKPDYAQV